MGPQRGMVEKTWADWAGVNRRRRTGTCEYGSRENRGRGRSEEGIQEAGLKGGLF